MKGDGRIALLDLTLLDKEASESDLEHLIGRANKHLPAAICVFSEQLDGLRDMLDPSINLACLSGGFPSCTRDSPALSAEIRAARDSGADEIDMVLEPGMGLEDSMLLMDSARRASEGLTLKVILETPLHDERSAMGAARIALMGGADFVKSCTGRRGACSIEAAGWLAREVRRHHTVTGELRGVKLSGGIRTSEDLEALLSAVTEEGLSVTDDQYLRIGASSLLDSLLSE